MPSITKLLKVISLIILVLPFGINAASLGYNNGLIRMPDANFYQEGYLTFNYSNYYPYQHYTFSASPFNWLEASFFYVDVNSVRYPGTTDQSGKDKGFSAKIKLKNQGKYPALAVGFNDVGGTGLFSSEYIVASYKKNKFDFSLGLGWGLFGGINNFTNPFTKISDEFKQRRTFSNKTGGTIDANTFFKGDASLFGGIKFYPSSSKNLALIIEYDSHNFTKQYGYFKEEESRINYGLSYKLNKNIDIGYYKTEGNELSFNVVLNKDFSIFNSGNIAFDKIKNNNKAPHSLYSYLLKELRSNNILLQNADIDDESRQLVLKYIQLNSNNEKEAANTIANEIEKNTNIFREIYLVPANGSVDYATYEFRDGNLVDRNKKKNSPNQKYEFNPKINYPINNISPSIGFKTHVGSPAGFVFGELYLGLNFSSVISKGWEFDSLYTVPIVNNYNNLSYPPAYTSIEPVRIEVQNYLKQGTRGFETFQLSNIRKLNHDSYLLLMAGHFEQMFSGAHVEYLKEFNRIFSYGFEISSVVRRDFDKSFDGFKDYKTLTGHLNFNLYESIFDINISLSVGKYLARDSGYTLSFSRLFHSGLEIGAYFTRTNLTYEEFGEGSFDKGVFIKYPLNIFSGKNKKGYRSYAYNPITRDGGAKLNISKRLRDIINDPGFLF